MELKEVIGDTVICPLKKFLIHRVELKGSIFKGKIDNFFPVSNSPCGVESPYLLCLYNEIQQVSNSPCGVESKAHAKRTKGQALFLIHRVELKEASR